MRHNSLVFSHQLEVAERLSLIFENTIVVTADSSIDWDFHSLQVLSSRWVQGKRFLSAIRFLRLIVPVMLKNRDAVIFSHMTDVQSFLIAPLGWLLRMKHYIWYAHTGRSPYLYLSYPFLTRIITSTRGSCPIKSKKVLSIGQGVDSHNFKTETFPLSPPLRWYVVGRIDPTKNLEEVIQAVSEVRKTGKNLTLDIYGSSSSSKTKSYEIQLQEKFQTFVFEGWLRFNGSVSRQDIRQEALVHDGFIHAFRGSLDKTLIEAAMSKRIIATVNQEYFQNFSTPTSGIINNQSTLTEQLRHFLTLDSNSMNQLLIENFNKATLFHSLDNWIIRLVKILNND